MRRIFGVRKDKAQAPTLTDAAATVRASAPLTAAW